MTEAQNPFGLHTVTPVIISDDIEAVTNFIVHVLDGKLRGTPLFSDDGRVKHVELQIGDSIIMMGQPTHENTVRPSSLYVYVPNCDSAYKKALLMGAKSIEEPRVHPHGDRLGGVRDPAGNNWWLVTHVGES